MPQRLNRRRFLQTTAAVAVSGLATGVASSEEKPAERLKLLMLDPKAVQRRSHIELRMQRPTRHPDNPLLRPDKPWEFGYIYPTAVHHDPKAERWRMWYAGYRFDGKQTGFFCLAESKDGLRWERPSLDLVEYDGSRRNNLMAGDDGPVLYDPRDPDAPRRYKMLNIVNSDTASVSFSPDGLNWKPSKHNPVARGVGDQHGLLGWDERIDKYVAYWRLHGHNRQYAYATSPDFEQWSRPQKIRTVDDHDPLGTYLYQMLVFKVAGLYLCVAPVLHVDRSLKDNFQTDPAGLEQTVDMQLLLSHDGIEWQRMFNRQPFMELGVHESWDDAQLYPTIPVTVGDEVRLYYSGCNVRHNIGEFRLCGKQTEGRWRGSCIGLATLKRDRWMGAIAGAQPGELLTRPFKLSGAQIKLNAEVGRGQLQAELTDPVGKTLPGFGREDSQLGTKAGLEYPLTWRKGELRDVQGKEVCLRITLTKAELYAVDVAEPT